jgi:hypothetical protein
VTERKQSKNKPRKVAPKVEAQHSEVPARRSTMVSLGRLAVVIALGAIALICCLIFRDQLDRTARQREAARPVELGEKK